MTSPIKKLISSAAIVEGSRNPVAYDKKYSQPYGYWICSECVISFYSVTSDVPHLGTCSSNKPLSKLENRFIYVLGPNENGKDSPYNESDIEEIKKLAKKNIKK